jgi:hypothetical protein
MQVIRSITNTKTVMLYHDVDTAEEVMLYNAEWDGKVTD